MPKPDYYQQKINQSLAYIDTHISGEISVQQLAQAANFSLFHFQRIFKSIQGESPYEAILRLRLEKSIFMLKHRDQLSISEIAYQVGFKSIENFSRQFKARFDFTPSAYRKDTTLQNSRIYQEKSENDFYTHIEESREMPAKIFTVVVEELDLIHIAYIRAIFGTDGSILVRRYQDLMDWANRNALPIQGELRRFGMSIDHPEVTPANKYRYDFALSVPKEIEGEGLIEKGQLVNGLYATIHCQGVLYDVAQAWDQLYKNWLPQSGYIPRDYPAIEEFVQGPEEIGWETFNIKCRIPIEKRK